MTLRLENVGLVIQNKTLLNHISFEHHQGFLGIIGPNGAGKSTLLKIISGFCTPSSGSVQWQEKELGALPAHVRARTLALVSPRETQPTFIMDVKAYLKLGRAPYQDWRGVWREQDEKVLQAVLAVTDVGPLLSQPLQQLSSGEWQRVQMSRALIQEPDLLLLDEPTSHLDIGAQIELLRALRQYRQKGLTLAVLHDLNLAAQYMDSLLLLHRGKQITNGPPEQVLTAEQLKNIYGQRWDITRHAVTGKPVILPVF